MDFRILEVCPDLGDEHLEFLVAPVEDACENRRRVGLDGFDLLYPLVHT